MIHRKMLKIAKAMLIAVWSIFILKYLVLVLPKEGVCWFSHCDKVVHLILFAILTLFLFIFFIDFIDFKVALLLSLILSSIYGVLIEYLQKYFPDRFFSYEDMFFNFLGGLVVCFIFLYINSCHQIRSRKK